MTRAYFGPLIDLMKHIEDISAPLPDGHEGTIYADVSPANSRESTPAVVYSVADDEEELAWNVEGRVYFLEMEIALEVVDQYEAICKSELGRTMTPLERLNAVRHYAEHDAYIDERDLWPELE